MQASRNNGAERDRSVDILRGMAIYAVVYIHGSWTALPPGTAPLVPGRMFTWAVPVFLILAAMFGFKKLEAAGEIRLAFIVPRLFRLCIPFLFWTFANAAQSI